MQYAGKGAVKVISENNFYTITYMGLFDPSKSIKCIPTEINIEEIKGLFAKNDSDDFEVFMNSIGYASNSQNSMPNTRYMELNGWEVRYNTVG